MPTTEFLLASGWFNQSFFDELAFLENCMLNPYAEPFVPSGLDPWSPSTDQLGDCTYFYNSIPAYYTYDGDPSLSGRCSHRKAIPPE